MIERFLRFVNGSLLVCACGSNISRFLNLCARHEIMFWKIQPDSPTQVSFYIRLQDLYELRPYLRKTKTRIHIRKRIGFPFFWQKYRARKLGIFVLLCVMAGVWVLSTRIWRIEIKGNSSLGEDAILEYLSAHNVTYGMPAKELTALGGGGLAAAALLALWRYYFVAKRQFGGITGDLAGWFLQRAELWMLAALAVSQWGGVL